MEDNSPLATQLVLEDPLSHLPCSAIHDFRRGKTIYNQGEPATGICLVLAGKVKVCRMTNIRQVLVDIYQPDDFFGESALAASMRSDSAIALEDTQTMTWSISEIQRIAADRPKLAIALSQLLVQRLADVGHRIDSFAADNIPRRLARALIRFSERLGHPGKDGAVQMIPFTHELLSQYVGTSREIVTHYMNDLRRQGFLNYSRKGSLLNADALKNWLNQEHAVDRGVKHSSPAPETTLISA